MSDTELRAREVQNLKEIIEVAKQISSSLEVEYILKNVNYIVLGKYHPECSCFILPKDIDDDSPVCHIFRGTKRETVDANFSSINELLDFFNTEEFNQITFKQFKEQNANKSLVAELEQYNPEFLIPLKGDKGLIGIYMQGKMGVNQFYSLSDVEFCINILSFTSIALENASLFRQATVDRMTKLYTHHQFQKRLEEEIKKSKRYGTKFSLLMFDIDHFKTFNDTYGHLQGDIIIKDIAKILMNSVRDVDFPCRYGGEEFISILPETDVKSAANVAERIRQTVQAYDFPGENGPFKVTISLGVIDFRAEYVQSNEDIIELVDKALYNSKESGRNRVSIGNYVGAPKQIIF